MDDGAPRLPDPQHTTDIAAAIADRAFANRYELGESLGSGAMGVVYRGVQKTLYRPVAIKFLSAELSRRPEYRERFLAEGQVAAGLVHSNVIAIYDYGVAGGVPYLVTEYIPGKTLRAILAEGMLDHYQVLEIGRGLLAGLQAIHQLGVVHRDLKPGNVQIGENHPFHIKILDFGLARQWNRVDAAAQEAGVAGTPEYMAPEQIVGGQVTPVTDLYALSVTLYEMILGSPPFQAPTRVALIQQHLLAKPAFPTELLSSVKVILEKGLAKNPLERFQSAGEFRLAWDELHFEMDGKASFFNGPPPTLTPPRPASRVQVSRSPSQSGHSLRNSQQLKRLRRLAHPGWGAWLIHWLGNRRSRFGICAAVLALAVFLTAILWHNLKPTPKLPVSARKHPSNSTVLWLSRLGRVDSLSRKGSYLQAGEILSNFLNYHYYGIKELTLEQTAESDLAQALDAAIVTIISAGIRASGPMPGENPPRTAVATGLQPAIGPYLVELIRIMTTDQPAVIYKSLGMFLVPREDRSLPFPITEGLMMHQINALRWLRYSVGLATNPPIRDLVVYVGWLELILRAHPEHPIGAWSASLLQEVFMAVQDFKTVARLKERQNRIWELLEANPSRDIWTSMDRYAERTRGQLGAYLAKACSDPDFMANLRSGLVLAEIVARVFDALRHDGDIYELIDTLPLERQAAARQVWELLGAQPIRWDRPRSPELLIKLLRFTGPEELPLETWVRTQVMAVGSPK